jgi:DNA-binding transcriptional regulator YiaG
VPVARLSLSPGTPARRAASARLGLARTIFSPPKSGNIPSVIHLPVKALTVSNLAAALKEEITRLVRKELRQETESLKHAASKHRSEIAALKRRVSDLEKSLARASKAPRTAPALAGDDSKAVRFSAPGLRKLRDRLDLSAHQLGLLLEVSPQSIYNWESGTIRPRPEQVRAIASVRALGKREIAARLSAIQSA